jgi:hypothetical protein
MPSFEAVCKLYSNPDMRTKLKLNALRLCGCPCLIVCWEQMRSRPGTGFVKTRMDAGQELLISSFRSGDAPVQTLHPHWQVAIEDTSPMNLCLRRDAHMFIGGFPEAAEFVVDMEDGAYMMALFEVYSGVKWLGAPTVLYVRRRSDSFSCPSLFHFPLRST